MNEFAPFRVWPLANQSSAFLLLACGAILLLASCNTLPVKPVSDAARNPNITYYSSDVQVGARTGMVVREHSMRTNLPAGIIGHQFVVHSNGSYILRIFDQNMNNMYPAVAKLPGGNILAEGRRPNAPPNKRVTGGQGVLNPEFAMEFPVPEDFLLKYEKTGVRLSIVGPHRSIRISIPPNSIRQILALADRG